MKKYYSIENIKKINADFSIIDGGRNIGKTYAFMKDAVTRACKTNCERGTFAYIRRKKQEINIENIDAYVDRKEIREWTKGKWDGIKVKKGSGKKFYFYKIDGYDENGNPKMIWSEKPIGQAFCLFNANDYKSLNYDWLEFGIFEEYQTPDNYLADEVDKLLSLHSSLKREKPIFSIYMVANTVSRVNPYVDGFGLTNYKKQEKGTIDIYKLYRGVFDNAGNEKYYTVAREYCAENEDEIERGLSDLLLDKYSKRKRISTMLARGDWQELHQFNIFNPSKEFFNENEIIYQCYFIYDDNGFNIRYFYDNDNDFIFPYIVPFNKNKLKKYNDTRIISNHFYISKLYTKDFSALSDGERYLFDIIPNFARFCDNLTGNEFFQCYNNI